MSHFTNCSSDLSVSGTVFCFGDGRNGQLGVRMKQQSPMLSTPCAVPINCPAKIIQVDCGAFHTAALSGKISRVPVYCFFTMDRSLQYFLSPL